MSKTYAGNFFEDFRVGQVLAHGTPRTLTEGDTALYVALTGSRFPLHCAAPAAQSVGFERQTVDDLLAFHVAFGKTVADVSFNAVANLGYADVRFLKTVYPGDTLHSESRVIGLKQNSSGKNGNVYVRSDAFNQFGDRVLTWARWVMVHKKDLSRPAPTPIVPELPAYVQPERLSLPPGLDGARYMTTARYNDNNRELVLEYDRQAITWMQDHIVGSPVIAEANTPLYRWGNRISIYTGLPNVVGYDTMNEPLPGYIGCGNLAGT